MSSCYFLLVVFYFLTTLTSKTCRVEEERNNLVHKMAPTYKLTYFPLTALGEPIRWILSYGNIEFEDYRFKVDDFATKIKPNLPFGKVPILEIGDKVLHQSSAICRYLASENNLIGKTPWDAIQADIVVDTVTDLRSALATYYYDENEKTKAPKLEPLQKETIPYYMTRLDKIVEENKGYFVNGQLTWADIYFVAVSEYMQRMSGLDDLYAGYPNLIALREKITAIPQIKAWIAKRPKDEC